MYHISYISRATKKLPLAGFEELCNRSDEKNKLLGVTGLLLYDGVRYMQVIAGDALDIICLMAKIAHDDRHDRIAYVTVGELQSKAFNTWTSACIDKRNVAENIGFTDKVKFHARNVENIVLRASLIGFAVMAN